MINIKTIFKFSSVIFLYFTSSLLFLLPLLLININFENLTTFHSNLYSLFSQLFLLIILLIIFKKKLKEDFYKLKNNLSILNVGFKYWGIGLLFMFIFNLLIITFFTNESSINETLVEDAIFKTPFIMFFLVNLIGPIIEELVFRANFKDLIKSKYPYILISGITFGLLHVLSATSLIQFLFIGGYTALGIAFSTMYYKTNNIYVPIIIHIIHNTLLYILMFI